MHYSGRSQTHLSNRVFATYDDILGVTWKTIIYLAPAYTNGH